MKNIKKSFATLGLASTLLFNAVGCSSGQNKKIDDYYLVYLDDTFYLTTRRISSLKNNGERVYYSYFIDTESFKTVGYLYDPVVGDDYTEYNPGHGRYNAEPILDYNYCEGKYGYGNLLPVASVIPLNTVVSTNEHSNNSYDYLMSNKDELHKKIEDSNSFNNVQIIDYYEWYSNYTDSNKFKHETGEYRYDSNGRAYIKYRTENFKIYICETKERGTDILLGYRCSFNNADSGYNQVYNILDGSITYIGSDREDSYVSVKEYDYQNTNNLTLEEIYDKVTKEGLDSLNSKLDISDSFAQRQETLINKLDVKDEKERSYCTNDYSLIYLNNNYYLARFEDGKSRNLVGDYVDRSGRNGRSISIRSYFDAQTGTFIGNQLDLGPDNLIDVEEQKIDSRVVRYYIYDSKYYDYEIFAGSYGYGALLPKYSIIPLSNLVSSEFFTQEQFDFFSSNSEKLADRVKASLVWNEVSYVTSYQYNYYPNAIFPTKRLDSTEKKNMSLSKYVCEKTDGQFDVFYGYRCSHNNTDAGNEYIYDIFGGNIIYIGKNKETSYIRVSESVYDNSNRLSIDKLYDKVINDEKSHLKNNGDTLTSTDKTNSSTELVENSNQSNGIVNSGLGVETDDFGESLIASDILVIDTSKIEITSEFNSNFMVGDYDGIYFLCDTKRKSYETNSSIFKDLFNEADSYVSPDLAAFDYFDYEKSIFIGGFLKESSLLKINDYLRSIGRDDLVKDEYTLEEISEVRSTILGLDKTRKLEINN